MDTPKNNPIGWVEIPVHNMERATKFYETVLGIKLEHHKLGNLDMGWFPWNGDGKGAGTSLVKHAEYKPSPDGILVYLTAPSGDLTNELARVEDAGGVIISGKKSVGAEDETYGFMAVIADSEGNHVALHSGK